MNHTTLAVVAIVATTAALLITASTLGATQTFAHKKYNKVSQRSNAEIEQRNHQSATCIQPSTSPATTGPLTRAPTDQRDDSRGPISCNEIGLNENVAPATSANVITH